MTVVEHDPPPVPPDADDRWLTSDRLGHQLIRLIRLIERRHPSKVGPDGVERAAYVLLARLVLEGPRRSNALADAVHSDPSTVSRQVAALVRVGLVERRSDPEDGRASLLAATDEGRRVFEANRDLRNREISRVTEAWDEDDRVLLVSLLERLTTDLARAFEPTPSHPAEHVSAARGGEEDR